MLYDSVFYNPNIPKDKKDFLEGAVVVRADNVADYLFGHSTKAEWNPCDFPNISPPFPNMWFEYQTSGGYGNMSRIGILALSFEKENTGTFFSSLPLDDSCKWITVFSVYLGENGKIFNTGQSYIVQIDSNGMMLNNKIAWGTKKFLEMGEKLIDSSFITFCLVPMFAISLMHCKNVEIVEHRPGSSHKERRNRPRITYHTLEIEPMKKILRTEGKIDETGIKMALHICRGHFKDFSKGKGLFGKYKGLYWWDNQVRGSQEYGESRKDYSVNPVEGQN